MASATLDRVIEQLLQPGSTTLKRGAEVFAAALLDQPLGTLIDLRRSTAVVLVALTTGAAERLVEDHVTPGWFRQLERLDTKAEQVGAFLPDEIWDKLEHTLSQFKFPQGNWAKDLLELNLLRELLAPVVQDTLTNFAKRMPGASLGGGIAAAGGSALGGLAGRLKKQVGESAKGFADVGRSVVGGIEGRLQKSIADLSRTAQDEFRAALVDRLRSPEGRRILEAMRRHAIAQVRRVSLAEVMRDLEDTRALVTLLAPGALAHNAGRAEISRAVMLEVDAVLEAEGERPVRYLLEELGQLEAAREVLESNAAALAQRLLARPDVRQFLAELLEPEPQPS